MRVVFFAVIICKIINFANDFSGMTSKSFFMLRRKTVTAGK